MGIKSPCKAICSFDVATGLCKGCWRTSEERARWPAMTEDEKLATMVAIDLRKEKYPTLPITTSKTELDNAWDHWLARGNFGTA